MPRRQVLFRQGEPRHRIFLITSGGVKVTRLGPAGKEVILWLKGPGDVVGGLGTEPGQINECGAEAIEPCHVVFWDAAALAAIAQRSPILQRNTVTILAARIGDLQDRFCELATEKVALRLARTLIRLLECGGRRNGGVARINLSREELAQMMGTTLFSVSRLLAEWTHRGIVDARREEVLVYDDSKLLELGEERLG